MRAPSPPTRVLRLLAARGRLVSTRPAAVAAGLWARLTGDHRVHVAWPDVAAPMFLTAPAAGRETAWMAATFEPAQRRGRHVDAATWSALRARGALIGTGRGLAVQAAERALGRRLTEARALVYAASSTPAVKANAFVFEAGGSEPIAVVKALPLAALEHRLRREIESLEAIRARVDDPATAAALPAPPLWSGQLDGVYVVVETVDPLARATGRASRDRAVAWLRDLQRQTAVGDRPFAGAEARALADTVARGWAAAGTPGANALRGRAAGALDGLVGSRLPVVAVHGDFWRGNVAAADGSLRVYDWEWAETEGRPLFDLWGWELGDVRAGAARGRAERPPSLPGALARVEAELERMAVDRRFALATLAPAIAELTFRGRWQLGVSPADEPASVTVMTEVERFLLDRLPA